MAGHVEPERVNQRGSRSRSGSRWEWPASRARLVAMLLVALVVIGVCGIAVLVGPAGGPDARSEVPRFAAPPTGAVVSVPRSTRDAMICSSFATVDYMVTSARRDEREPGPRGFPANRPPTDFIGLADALSNTERQGASGALNSALTAYVYSLANLGATINHNESRDAIETMDQLTGMARGTLTELCRDA